MNERIRELWDKAAEDTAAFPSGQNNSWQTQVNFMDRFAKLIVRECLSLGDVLSKHYINTHPEQKQAWLLASIADYSNEIKKHFGVEE
jgi:hypothetical protein